jgi:hypothetical protein
MDNKGKKAVRRRPDYCDILGVAAIVLGIAVIAGIIYTYVDVRPLTASSATKSVVDILNIRQHPADR